MRRLADPSDTEGPLRAVLDPETFEGFRLAIDRVDLRAGESHAWGPGRAGERMLYVIEGSGVLLDADSEHRLERETVVWLEPHDACAVTGGPEGLAVLAVRAPTD